MSFTAYLGLCTLATFGEFNGPGYQRQPTTWGVIGSSLQNFAAVTFGPASGAWPAGLALGYCGGTLAGIYFVIPVGFQAVAAGGTLTVAPGDLSIDIAAKTFRNRAGMISPLIWTGGPWLSLNDLAGL